ncbi:Rossmann fold nucleotide-binding protein [Nocardioides marmotae]|uniref:Rossmann fold nucleotide-binding protein n=1 Tax=Nocardioides marmotae TaxID=2663857 RepID=UPI001326D5B8|nr:Rossmann fold nucleotide-binding protein [Nocardioides marmotae]MBC9732246.1 Rossmann fold nucleotide-binding protein [Nocardioides marmotae]MTB83368.1 Rossmann fold nucleotide-binding protein [Nocardioides marmotae]
MRHTHGRVVQVESLADFDRRMAAGATSLSGWRVRAVDLSDRTDRLARCRVAGAAFLGCTFAPGEAERLLGRGALVLPVAPGAPLDTARAELYTAAELYGAGPYESSLDARAYAWSQEPPTPETALAKALHDHAIDQALTSWVTGRRLVGVMGGHALERGSEGYAAAAALGRALGGTCTVATGGGPGAMEAANLGARLARRPAEELTAALADLARVPAYRPSIGAWARVALEVCDRHPDPVDTLGIPTWHYGHEPPNVFATSIAKYFRNATREAVLLEVCDGGIVFLPGAAGTVQEVFQDACENYYADESSLAPMVLVGRTHWTETFPAWPLLRALARERPMAPHVHLVDTVAEAAALVAAGAPRPERDAR